MQNKMCYVFLLFLLINGSAIAGNETDVVFIDRMMISDKIVTGLLNAKSPKHSVWTFRNQDEIIFYYASLGIINPTKKKYTLNLLCVDRNGNTVISVILNSDFTKSQAYHLAKDRIVLEPITLVLDPKKDILVKGQLIKLENNTRYFIKLYFEKKLIGITEFRMQTPFDYRIN